MLIVALLLSPVFAALVAWLVETVAVAVERRRERAGA